MNENREIIINSTNESNTILIVFLQLLIATMFIYPLIYYNAMWDEEDTTSTSIITLIQNQTNNASEIVNNDPNINNKLRPSNQIKKQPSCTPLNHQTIALLDLCQYLNVCTANDKHNLAKHKLPTKYHHNIPSSVTTTKKNAAAAEATRNTIIGYMAAALLVTSLAAAILELYKAKCEMTEDASAAASSSNISSRSSIVGRKCSLADLTVLKHNRKELVRRDSILDMGGDGTQSRLTGRKVSRPPLRLN